jgi:hypothetical protein
MPNITLNDTWEYAKSTTMFAAGFNMELSYNASMDTIFNDDSYKKYMRYAIHTMTMQGLTIELTPKQFLEGYYDPKAVANINRPIINGGNPFGTGFETMNGNKNMSSSHFTTMFTGANGNIDYARHFARQLG